MAVIEANQVTKAKLVFQVQTEEGDMPAARFPTLQQLLAMMRCMLGC